MSLKERIQQDVKDAMRAKEKERLATIRLITAAIKQREVDERIELDDEQVLVVLDKMCKQRRESISQFDAAATPMFESFTNEPNLTPYKHEAARINLNAINEKTAYGAERSLKMDFTEYDRIDDFELNEILWRSIKGKDAPLPPAARRAIAYRKVEK